MTYMLSRIAVEDYDAWKEMFDAGRDSVRSSAKGHRILRSVDDPGELFIQVEFQTADDARAARESLLASGALDRVTVKTAPSIAETAEQVDY
jgi:hypothetical protein